jgi:GTP:adenosylcobinamide-phosphate guanylyltransferase
LETEAQVPAVVLAGQRNEGVLASRSDVPFEALIPLRGRPMLAYVLDALDASGAVSVVHVVGPELADGVANGQVSYITPGASLFENLRRGLAAVPQDRPALVVTADVPLITGPMVRAFVEAARGEGADIVYPLIPRSAVEEAFPAVHRTYFRFREGVFTGGNLFWVSPGAMVGAWPHAEQLLAHRKSPLKLARDIGLAVLVRFLLGRLTLGEVERVAGRLLHVRGKGLVFPHPEVGVDVDKVSDLDLVLDRLGSAPDTVRHA